MKILALITADGNIESLYVHFGLHMAFMYQLTISAYWHSNS